MIIRRFRWVYLSWELAGCFGNRHSTLRLAGVRIPSDAPETGGMQEAAEGRLHLLDVRPGPTASLRALTLPRAAAGAWRWSQVALSSLIGGRLLIETHPDGLLDLAAAHPLPFQVE